MFGLRSRILPVLQLTRMALVFTALSNTLCAYLLFTQWQAGDRLSHLDFVRWQDVLAIIVVSCGLYGFGMSLNDIIDRRRDQLTAPARPLPSGRIRLHTAHWVCVLLATSAICAGVYYAWGRSNQTMLLLILAWTVLLIAFYNLIGKYLVSAGILALGLIRFFHAAFPAGKLVMVWHPLLLLNHVVLLSMICYALEDKRPPLTHKHRWTVLLGLLWANVTCLGYAWKRQDVPLDLSGLAQGLSITPELLYPLGGVIGFIFVALILRKRMADRRALGQSLMLAGLLWLIVYDVLFIGAYVGWYTALAHLLLLPTAYAAVKLMRWWSRLVILAQPPTYQRAR